MRAELGNAKTVAWSDRRRRRRARASGCNGVRGGGSRGRERELLLAAFSTRGGTEWREKQRRGRWKCLTRPGRDGGGALRRWGMAATRPPRPDAVGHGARRVHSRWSGPSGRSRPKPRRGRGEKAGLAGPACWAELGRGWLARLASFFFFLFSFSDPMKTNALQIQISTQFQAMILKDDLFHLQFRTLHSIGSRSDSD